MFRASRGRRRRCIPTLRVCNQEPESMPRATPSRSSGGRSIPRLFGLFGGAPLSSASPANCSTPASTQSHQTSSGVNALALARLRRRARVSPAPGTTTSHCLRRPLQLPASNASLPKSPARLAPAGVPSHLGPDRDVVPASNDKSRALMDDIR